MQDHAAIFRCFNGTGQRFHWRMRQKWEVKGLFHHLVGFVDSTGNFSLIVLGQIVFRRRVHCRHQLFIDVFRAAALSGGVVEGDVQRFAGLQSCPCVFGINRYTCFVWQSCCADEAFHVLGCTIIKRSNRTTAAGWALDDHNHLIVELHVHGVHGGAVDLRRRILAADIGVADQLELGWIFQAWFFRRCQRACCCNKLTNRRFVTCTRDHAIFQLELCDWHIPGMRGSLKQNFTGCSACFAILLEAVEHGGRAAGALNRTKRGVVVKLRIGWCELIVNRIHADAQLFGNQGGEAGCRSLPFFKVLDDGGDGAVSCNLHERVEHGSVSCTASGHGAGWSNTDDENGCGRRCCAFEEATTRGQNAHIKPP